MIRCDLPPARQQTAAEHQDAQENEKKVFAEAFSHVYSVML